MNCSGFREEIFYHPAGFNCSWAYWNSTLFLSDDYDSLYEVPAGVIVLLSVFYGTISVVAVVGNFLVMWIVATSRRMQNVTNCFIANLALADIVIGLFAIPFQLEVDGRDVGPPGAILATATAMQSAATKVAAQEVQGQLNNDFIFTSSFFQAALLQRWNLPHFMCPFCPFVQVLSVNVSVFTLTAIAVDRHRAVLNPLSAPPSKLRAKILLACIWVLAAVLATPMAIALSVTYVEEQDSAGRSYLKPFCNNTRLSNNGMMVYRMILVSVQYLTPLCVISYAYARMALRLWGSRAPGNAQHSRDANLMRNKKKVIKMLVIVVALFAICWLPLQTYNVLQDIFPQINGYRYINIIWFCCDWLAMSNSCYNPFIYGIYNEKFKIEFKQRCPFRSARKWSSSFGGDSIDMDKALHRYGSMNQPTQWVRYSSRRGNYTTTNRRHYVYHCANSNNAHHSSQTEIEELCL